MWSQPNALNRLTGRRDECFATGREDLASQRDEEALRENMENNPKQQPFVLFGQICTKTTLMKELDSIRSWNSNDKLPLSDCINPFNAKNSETPPRKSKD